ncbi:MAG: Crp/Fnr family transcriptional regulator [Thermoanaerobaculia bacterium]
MTPEVQDLLLEVALYRRLSEDDREHLAAAATVERFDKGEAVFHEGDPAQDFFTLVRGRVKVYKVMPNGRVVILEILGPGDPVGAVAVYESLAYPATAEAMDETLCVRIPKDPFFQLLETRPSLARGLLKAMTHRIVVLADRFADHAAGKVETRFARLFLKLASEMGQSKADGVFIPMSLSRQELADLMGTTVETSIRIMSRWGKEGVVQTEKSGFLVTDRRALEQISAD